MKTTPKTARHLRRNQTHAERTLWVRLRDRRLAGWKFRRQFPIDRFVVDFFPPMLISSSGWMAVNMPFDQ
jgi:very-short-patch-repair endonuclease